MLGHHASLTATHLLAVIFATLACFDQAIKGRFEEELEPLDVWDGWLHAVLPVSFMVSLVYASTKSNQEKERQMLARDNGIVKKVL